MTDEQRAQQVAALGEKFSTAIGAMAETALADPAAGSDAIATVTVALGAACAVVLAGMATALDDACDLDSPAAKGALAICSAGFLAGFNSAMEDLTQAVPA